MKRLIVSVVCILAVMLSAATSGAAGLYKDFSGKGETKVYIQPIKDMTDSNKMEPDSLKTMLELALEGRADRRRWAYIRHR